MFSLAVLFATVSQGNCDGSTCPIPTGHSVSEPIRSCSPGFYYDSSVDCCTKDVAVDPLFSCSHVGGVLDGITCRCLSGQIISCPTGYRYKSSDQTCVASELTPMIPSCAGIPDSLLTPDGTKCIFDAEVDAHLRCPSGSHLVDDVCVGHRTLPDEYTVYTCPTGWHRVGRDLCEMLEEISCDHVSVSSPSCSAECPMVEFKSCRNPCKVSGKVRHHKGRKLCSEDDCEVEGHSADVMCEVASCQMYLGLAEAPPSDIIVPTCTRTTHLPAKRTCSSGTLYGDRCVEDYFVTPVIECPLSCKTVDGRCLKEKILPSEYVCPSGFEVKCDKPGKSAHPSRCECVSVHTMSPLIECPVGTEYLPSGECLLIRPAEAYCADVDFTVSGDICVGKDHEPVRLEYIVTYVTEQACELEDCIRDRVNVTSKTVRNKHVTVDKSGKTSTRCDVETCVTASGVSIVPGKHYSRYPEILPEDASDFNGTLEPEEFSDDDNVLSGVFLN